MPKVNPDILQWAGKTVGLPLENAVNKLNLRDARGVPAVDRLMALENGDTEPTRPMLLKMAKQYHRPFKLVDEFVCIAIGQQQPNLVIVSIGCFLKPLELCRISYGRSEVTEEDFSDEHSLDEQRYYSMLCMVYGSDPGKYSSLKKEAGFSDDRAGLCVEDYKNISESRLSLLASLQPSHNSAGRR